MRGLLIGAGVLSLCCWGAQAQAQTPRPDPNTPSAIAVFSGKSLEALAKDIRAACGDHGFETQVRNAQSLTCQTFGLTFPKTGELQAHRNVGYGSDMDAFTFALESQGDRVVVFEKTRHAIALPVSSIGDKPSDAARAREQARWGDVQARVERFLTDLGGVLQPTGG